MTSKLDVSMQNAFGPLPAHRCNADATHGSEGQIPSASAPSSRLPASCLLCWPHDATGWPCAPIPTDIPHAWSSAARSKMGSEKQDCNEWTLAYLGARPWLRAETMKRHPASWQLMSTVIRSRMHVTHTPPRWEPAIARIRLPRRTRQRQRAGPRNN